MAIINGTTSDDILSGTSEADVFDGGLGNDSYLFDIGSGQDAINNYDPTMGKLDVVQFGPGVLPADVTVTCGGWSGTDLVLSINGTTDTLTIRDYFAVTPAGSQYWDAVTGTFLTATQDMRLRAVEEIRFADGTTWTRAQLDALPIVGITVNGTSSVDTLTGTFGNDAINGLDGDDLLVGNDGNDTLDGGAGNDTLDGGLGNDTYLFDIGSGQDTIYDNDEGTGSLDVVQFGPGVLPADVTVTRGGWDGNALVLSINGATDSLTIQYYFGVSNAYVGTDPVSGMPVYQEVRASAVEEIRFADGTIWTMAQIDAQLSTINGTDGNDLLQGSTGNEVLNGLAGDDELIGHDGDDTLDGGTGNDMLIGGAGNDTYLFDIGGGQDVIYDYNTVVGSLDVVQFGAGVLPANVTASRSTMNGNDLVLSINGTTDSLTIANYFGVNMVYLGDDPVTGMPIFQSDRVNTVEEVRFADGTVWTQAYLDAAGVTIVNGTAGDDWLPGTTGNDVINGLAGNDHLIGEGGNDTLDGGAGNDMLEGRLGNDTYLFDIGGGQDIVNEYDTAAGSLDAVQFGAGVLPADVTATRGGYDSYDLVLSINGTTDSLTIANYFRVIPAGSTYWDPATGATLTATQDMRPAVVEELRFANGTVWTQAQFDALPVPPILGTTGNDTLQGSSTSDVINGLAGDDTLLGNGGNDTLDGGAGNDLLDGGLGNDIYLFDIGGGQDVIYSGSDNATGSLDVVQFGAGVLPADISVTRGGPTGNDLLLSINGTTDTLTIQDYYRLDQVVTGYQDGFPIFQQVRANTVEEVRFADGTVRTPVYLDAPSVTIVNGTDGDDWLQGTSGNDLINGLAGNDQLKGDAGNDTLNGGAGNDVLQGDWGNDTYLFDIGSGQDVIYDYDTTAGSLDVVQFGPGVLPANVTAARSTMNSNDLVLSINGTTDSLTIASYFRVIPAGSSYWDPATGTTLIATQDMRPSVVEEIRFADGTVWTQAQLDAINGTAGDDYLQGSTGNDVMNGLAGNDTLEGGDGNDTLDGGAGNDVLAGLMGNDTYLFDIGSGQDVIYDYDWTNSSLDVVQFGAGVLPANVTAARSTMNSNDLVLSINGTTDSLTIANYFAVNSVYMGTDPVTGMPIYQDERANTVEEVRFADGTTWTMAQMDAIFGIINGTAGDDLLQGGTGNDVIKGLAGNDTLDGDAGNDVLNGGSGNDLLNGGSGDDILDGGAGNDLLIGGEGNNIYLFGTGSGQDTIDYSATNSLSLVQIGVRAIDVTASRAVNSQNDLVLTINGTTDCLTIKGYFTNSGTQIQFGDGSTWLNSDVLRDLPVLLDGTDGADNIVAPNIGYWPLGGSFVPTNAIINGNAGDDTLVGADGNDTLNGGDGNDTLNGGAGNNTLNGGAGNDTINGSWGNDILDGGAGNDVLYGGGGQDTFLFGIGSGQDMIWGNSLTSVQMGAGLLPTDITVSRGVNDPYSLLVTINGTSDSLKISGYFYGDPTYPDTTVIQFDDGTRWNLDTFQNLPILRSGTDGADVVGAPNLYYYDASGNWRPVDAIVNGLAGDDYIYGAWGNDTLDGGAGNDIVLGASGNDTLNGGAGNDRLIGDYGNDTYLFGLGGGQDTIAIDTASNNAGDAVQFCSGIAVTDITAIHSATNSDDLVLSINGTTDSLTIEGYFSSPLAGIRFADGTVLDSAAIIQMTNRPPVAASDSVIVNEDGTAVISQAQLLANDTDPDGGALNVSGFDAVTALGNTVTQDAGGNFVLGIGNNYQSLGAGQTVTDSFTYTITDAFGSTSNATVNITITGSNDGPVVAASISSQQTNEDAAFTFIIPAGTFTDIDTGDVLTYTATLVDGTALPSWLAFDAATQTFSGTPANGDVGNYGVTVTATDIGGLSASSTFAVAVANVNDAPTVSMAVAGQATLEDAAFSFTVPAAAFSDVDQGDVLTYSATLADGTALPSWLTFDTYTSTQTFGGTPGNGDVGNYSITVTATDTSGLSASSTFAVAVANVNDTPIASMALVDQPALEDTAFSFTVPAGTFTDIDTGDVLTYSATLADGTALPSWLTFDAATQTFSGMPGNGNVGNYSVTVTATDTGGLSASNTFAVGVANVNDAPTVSMTLADQATLEDATFSFTVPAGTFDDVDFIHGDSLAYSVTLADGTALPSWLTFDAATQTFSGTPGNGDVGNLNVRVTATDMAGAGVSATFALDVQNVNDAPVAADDAVATNEDAAAQMSVTSLLANDHDIDVGDILSITGFDAVSANGNAVTQDALGNLVLDIGNRYQALAAGQTATDNFSYTVTDAAGATSTATVTVTINGVNDGPVAQDDNVSLSEDAALAATGNVLSNDSDVDQGTTLTIANAGTLQGNYGSLVLNADGTYSYALDNALVQSLSAGQTVTETFSYQATDGIASTPATLTVTINGSNDAALAAADTAAVQEDLSVAATGNVLVNDTDVDQGTVLQVSQAGVFSGLYGQLTLAADGSYTYALYYDSTAVQSLAEGQTVTEAFAYEATDGVVGTASTISFSITGSNDAPAVAAAIAGQQAGEDALFTFTVPAATFSDVDQGDVLTYSTTLADGTALPSWLTFDAATQTFSGTPANGDVGNYSVTVTATDAGGLSASSTFAVAVANVNDAPTVSMALADQATLEDATFSFTIPAGTFDDVDFIHSDSLTYAVALADGSALPAWLTFDAATQTLSGIPANGDVGAINIRVTATDTVGANVSSTFALNVQNVNDAPVVAASIAAQQTNEDAPFSFAVPAGSFTDVDLGDVLTYSATLASGGALPSWLVFDAATQTFSGTPANGDVGSYDVTVTASDAAGLSVPSTFAINVANVNDAPVISAALVAQNVTQGQAFNYALLADSFTDVDQGDVLTYSATLADGSALPAWLSFDAATLTFSGTPGAGSVADLSIVVTATDSGGLSANSSFVLAVSAPVFNGTSGGDVLTGTVYDDTMYGLAGNDTLNGGAGNDTLDGGTGSDTLKGGLGNDTYVVDSTGDSVSENSGEGTDTVQSAITYTLGSNVENLTLTGTNAINGTGNSTNNVLDGSLNTAANILAGGTGNDTYILGAGDTIVEQSSAGTDTVMTSASYTLGSNIENLTLTGTATVNATGNSLNNILIGNSADNVLNGRSGSDTMIGGAGNDTYVVGSSGDVVTENANEGADLVQSSVSYTLAGNVENLTLTGSNNINGTGNSLDNILVGNSVRNTLAGGAGNDLLNGGLGNDTLNGDAGNDILRGGDGDNILSDTAGANLLDGGAGIDTLTGNSGNEMFVGGTGDDIIDTGDGADILAFNLGDGMDVVNGGIGADNTISLGGGIGYANIALSKVNNDLILEVGNGDQITLANWYDTAANYKSVIDLQVMADAMAGFDPASGDPLMNQAVQNFDFTAIVNTFDQAHGGSATYMHWSATSELLASHLSGSDTMALGGDLAHQYGTNGSFTGMNLAAAQTALNDPQFGVQAQLLSPLQGLQGGAVTL